MKVFGFRRMTLLGIGFLLGSRMGRGPWEKAMGAWNEFQSRTGFGPEMVKQKLGRGDKESVSGARVGGNGHQSQKGQVNPGGKVMTEI
jgi:hypothetical protein